MLTNAIQNAVLALVALVHVCVLTRGSSSGWRGPWCAQKLWCPIEHVPTCRALSDPHAVLLGTLPPQPAQQGHTVLSALCHEARQGRAALEFYTVALLPTQHSGLAAASAAVGSKCTRGEQCRASMFYALIGPRAADGLVLGAHLLAVQHAHPHRGPRLTWPLQE